MMRAPTYEECIEAALAEHVRAWFDAHPPITADQAA